jgi:hypothetical protein
MINSEKQKSLSVEASGAPQNITMTEDVPLAEPWHYLYSATPFARPRIIVDAYYD